VMKGLRKGITREYFLKEGSFRESREDSGQSTRVKGVMTGCNAIWGETYLIYGFWEHQRGERRKQTKRRREKREANLHGGGNAVSERFR